MSRYLYLVRHGEQSGADQGVPDGPLSERGLAQAAAVADRLAGVPFDGAWCSPMQRALDTAAVFMERRPDLVVEPSMLLMDCFPSGPGPDTPEAFDAFFHGITPEEIAAGEAQMADARAEWIRPALDDRHELLITHNFVIGEFVRETFGAAAWRWLGLNQANAGLTIIRVRSRKPPVLICHNDLGHLPPALRTGMPVEQPY
ncbi:MAG: histidine phosphatase family protein [Actinomycetales bacterium]|nr:histidine phosphatase family protein [Actinomycetales bacterium]